METRTREVDFVVVTPWLPGQALICDAVDCPNAGSFHRQVEIFDILFDQNACEYHAKESD